MLNILLYDFIQVISDLFEYNKNTIASNMIKKYVNVIYMIIKYMIAIAIYMIIKYMNVT